MYIYIYTYIYLYIYIYIFRVSQKHRRKKTTLMANTPAKRSRPPIPNLMSPIQQLTCPPNPYIPPQFLLTFPSESVLKCLLINTLSLTNKIPEFHQLTHDTNPTSDLYHGDVANFRNS